MARKKAYNTHPLTNSKRIIDTILEEGKVEFSKFGIFSVKTMKARKGFNPGNGTYEHFPAYKKLSFVPSLHLRKRLQTLLVAEQKALKRKAKKKK